MSEQFTTPEQALIERLRRAPQPELSSEARAMIHARILDALNHPPMPVPRPALPSPMIVVVAMIVATALIAGGILFLLSQQNDVAVTPTAPATFTLIPPTETPTPSMTATPTSTPTPTVQPTASVEVISIIEGPVQKIDGNVIIVYGTPIQIPPDTTLTVGDVVRVESNDQSGTSEVVTVTPIVINGTPPAQTNPSSGEAWHDDGTCSHPPPDWAPANGWRRRCQGQEKDKDKGGKHNKGNDEGND